MPRHDDDDDGTEVDIAGDGYMPGASAVAPIVPDIHVPVVSVSSSLVRDWVRSALVPAALKRLYEIGMGVTVFKVPTMAGNVVEVPASAGVQTKALQGVIAVGVPQTLGLTGDGTELPGVLALGEWELDQARGEVHAPPRLSASGGIEVEMPHDPTHPEHDRSYTAPDGHEIVTIEDDAEAPTDERGAIETEPHIVDPDRNALAREFLARRRASKQGRISTNGSHPNLE